MKYLNLTILALLFSFSSFAQGPISGITFICAGSTSLLSDVPGGTWSSDNTIVATINLSGGLVTAGTPTVTSYAVITHSIVGGSATTTITVNPLPTVYTLSGGGGYCASGTGVPITLSGSASDVSYQLFVGAAATGAPVSGTGAALTYGPLTAAGPYAAVATNTVTGCHSNMSGSPSVIINPLPTPYTCSGGGVFCAGAPGIWFYLGSSSPAINYQLYGPGGAVGPVIAGTGSAIAFDSVIAAGTYSVLAINAATGCTNWMTDSVVIFINPALSPIAGTTTVCGGSTTQLSDPTAGGVWSCSNSTIATIGTGGLVMANTVSTPVQTVMTYSVSTGYGCVASTTITVNPSPTVFAVTGGGTYPSGGTGVLIGLAGSQTGVNYTLYYGSTVVSTIPGTGSALSFGLQTAAGTYSVLATNSSTCAEVMGSTTVATCTLPAVIIAPPSVCTLPATFTISDATPGGTWSSSNSTLATISPITGVSTVVTTAGPAVAGAILVITYTVAGCAATSSVTLGSASPILGSSTTCVGSALLLSDATTGGTWSSANTAVATVGIASGMTYGATAGTAVISYALATGCFTTHTVIIVTAPAPITGPSYVCDGSAMAISNSIAGGIWSSSNSSVATINASTGLVLGTAAGATNITYSLGTGCFTTTTITVNPLPASISGANNVCIGSQIILASGAGGLWSSSNPTVATVGSTTAVVTGVSAGTAQISYTISTGCAATLTVTANPLPSSISGITTVCTGNTTTLTNTVPGGLWSSSNLSIETVGSSTGIVTGVAVGGVTTIDYTLPSGCFTSIAVSIATPPTAISGPASVCINSTITLLDGTPGGYWSSGAPYIATVSPSGIVTGISAGFTSITYTMGGGTCYATYSVTVNPLPTPITGPSSVCAGSTTTFSDATPGGTWSTSVPSVATIGLNTGIAYGVSSGITNVNYTLSTGCFTTTSLTVIGTPSVTITASLGTTVCAGTTVIFSTALTGFAGSPTGYTWMLNGATIGSGTATFSNIPSSGDVMECVVNGISTCTSATVTTFSNAITMAVTPLPVVTASSSLACGGAYTLTASGATSYSWSPSTGLSCNSCAVTTIIPASSATYTVTGTTSGCFGTASVTVNGNRISGYISYAAGVSTDSFRVWLINYSPTDSLIISTDSTVSCMAGGTPYYQFDNEPAGNYMVKAALFGTVPGTSGYIPTYSLSSATWNTAASVNHTSAADTMHINMLYGTVPPGPGFIGGNVYSGAGRGTDTDIPVEDMIIYLENTATHVLTYTYTDINGAYAFSSLGYGDYVIYPQAFSYYTTPSAVITLNAANPAASAINFKQHTTFGTITPYSTTGISTLNNNTAITLFPNPTAGNLIIRWKGQVVEPADVIISDMLGREVYKTPMNISTANGQSQLNLAGIENGIYLITIKSDNSNFNTRLLIQK